MSKLHIKDKFDFLKKIQKEIISCINKRRKILNCGLSTNKRKETRNV